MLDSHVTVLAVIRSCLFLAGTAGIVTNLFLDMQGLGMMGLGMMMWAATCYLRELITAQVERERLAFELGVDHATARSEGIRSLR